MATITVPIQIDLANDCRALYQAFKGIGNDKNKVIEILGHRNSLQRSHIRNMYQKMYQVDLLQELKSEFHGNLERAMLLWMQDPSQREAISLQNSIKQSTYDNIVLVVLICMRTISQLKDIEHTYHFMFQRPLAKDLATCEARNVHIIKHLIEYLNYNQRAETPINMHHVRKDLEQSIKRQILPKDMMNRILNPPEHFAEMLYKSMRGMGTDDETLIRVIVTRAEIDMKDIKKAFLNKYNRKLEDMVASDTSGGYRKFLLTLIGSNSK